MIEFGVHTWLLILLLILASLLTWFSYRRTEPKLKGIRRWLLPGLRGLALALLLILLFEPAISRRINRTSEPIQVVLVDESQSISMDELPQALPDIKGETRLFGFGGAVRPIEHLAAAMDTAPRTDIASALEDIKSSLVDENLRSVLLISDGQYNTGRNPVYVAADYGIPIHTLVVGDTLQQQDLMIAQTVTNELAHVGMEIPVDISLLLQGYQNQVVTTSLYVQDSLISSQTSTISEGESTIPMNFVPHKEGLLQYTVTTTELDSEASLENNRALFTIRVLKRSQKFCLIGAAPHPDLIAIRNILTRDPTRQIDSYVQMQPGRFYEGDLPISLSEYDAIILVGFPGYEADNISINSVVEAAESGIPLLFMLTRQTDLNRFREIFGNILPVLPMRQTMLYDEASLQLTQDGIRDPLLAFPEALWDRLPPLITTTGRWAVTSDSRILGRANLRGITLEQPLFVVRSRAGHRTAAILGSGTWRWLNLAGNPVEMPRIWPQLLENLMQWLTTPEDDRTVRVEPAQTAFSGSEPINFSGQVYDESLNPISDAVVTVELTAPDGATYPYTMTNTGNGRYGLRMNALPEGLYSYTAQAIRMNVSMGTDTGMFTVGSMDLEHRSTRSDESLLRQIAYQSGGHFFTNATLNTLPDRLESDSLFTSTIHAQTLEFDLRQIPWILGLVVLLLGTEWIIRKRNGLA